MPSLVIHAVVNKKVAKELNIDSVDYYVGGISPDLSKLVGNTRAYSHFCDELIGAPNIDKFLYKYKKYLEDDFVLGYYVHLYTDYLFENYFVHSFLNEDRDVISKTDGTSVRCNEAILKQYLYNDYTDLNDRLIKKYKLDFSYLNISYKTNRKYIDEIPLDKLDLLFKSTLEIIDKSSERKNFLFNIKDIISFIEFCSHIIVQNIRNMNLEKFQ